VLNKLPAAGVDVDPRRDEAGFGRFAWVNDPEGNRVGLWETPKTPPA
jgi:predicted enzyme related to lactoylglutathione lyase